MTRKKHRRQEVERSSKLKVQYLRLPSWSRSMGQPNFRVWLLVPNKCKRNASHVDIDEETCDFCWLKIGDPVGLAIIRLSAELLRHACCGTRLVSVVHYVMVTYHLLRLLFVSKHWSGDSNNRISVLFLKRSKVVWKKSWLAWSSHFRKKRGGPDLGGGNRIPRFLQPYHGILLKEHISASLKT